MPGGFRPTRRRFLVGAASASVAIGGAAVLGTRTGLVASAPATPTRRVARVGWLTLTSPDANATYTAALRAGLRDLGYVEGDNLALEQRSADGREDRLPDLALELARLRLDVLVTASTEASLAALRAAGGVPLVFANSSDPLAAGLVDSLARPGLNATGLSTLSAELSGKRLEMLKSAVPKISRVAVLRADGDDRGVLELRTSGRWLGLQVDVLRVASADSIEDALQAARIVRADALVAVSSPVIDSVTPDIARFALSHGLPSISEGPEFTTGGGLMAYGANAVELCRRAATYVHRILSGARPMDLPVERAERFDLAVNLRTAQALGVVLPQAFLLQASEVVL